MTLKFNALVPPFDIAGGSGNIGTPGGWIDLTTVAGVDSSGATDSTTGLLNGIKEAFEKKKLAYIPSGEYKVGESGTGLVIAVGAVKESVEFHVYADPTVKIVGNSALGTNPVIELTPPSEGEYARCTFWFGNVERRDILGAGVVIHNTNDCTFDFRRIACLNGKEERSAGHGLELKSGSGVFCANNNFTLGASNIFWNRAIRLESPEPRGGGVGVQSNWFNVETLEHNACGIEVDGALDHNSRFNVFNIQVIGQSTEQGIINRSESNRYNIGISTGNAVPEVIVAANAFVHGWFESGSAIQLEPALRVEADIWNNSLLGTPVSKSEVAPKTPEPLNEPWLRPKLNAALIAASAGGAEFTTTPCTIKSAAKGVIISTESAMTKIEVGMGVKNGTETTANAKVTEKSSILKEVPEVTQNKLAGGMKVSGSGIAAGTLINELKPATEEILLNKEATKTEVSSLTYKPSLAGGTTVESLTSAAEIKISANAEASSALAGLTFAPATAATWSYAQPTSSKQYVYQRFTGALRVVAGKELKEGATVTTLNETPTGEWPKVEKTMPVGIARMTLSTKAKLTASNFILKEVPKTVQEKLAVGMFVKGTGIPTNTTIEELKGATEEIKLNKEATKTENQTLTFFPGSMSTTRMNISTTGVLTLPFWVNVKENEVIYLDGMIALE